MPNAALIAAQLQLPGGPAIKSNCTPRDDPPSGLQDLLGELNLHISEDDPVWGHLLQDQVYLHMCAV